MNDELKPQTKIDDIQDVTRIIKLISTTSVKNNPTDDRPNRVSSWLDDPESIVEDSKLFDYLQSLAADFSLLQPKSIFVSAPVIDGDLSDLDDLDLTQLTTLKGAMNSYHVKNVRQLLKNDNRSISDYAFLKELAHDSALQSSVEFISKARRINFPNFDSSVLKLLGYICVLIYIYVLYSTSSLRKSSSFSKER